VKLHHAVSLWLGLNGVKIAQNITKVGLHACLSNGHPNLWSNFNSVKLVKSETPSCGFSRVGFKRGQNSSSVAKVGMHACQSMFIWIYDQILISRNQSKVKLHRAILLWYGLNWVKLAQNVTKFGVHACLWNGHPNQWSNIILRNWLKVKLRHAVSQVLDLKGVKIARDIAKVGVHINL